MQICKKLAVVLFLGAALVLAGVGPALADNGKQAVAAEVNGKPIYKAELDKRVDLLLRQINEQVDRAPTEEELKELRTHVLDDMIEYEMLLSESLKQKIEVSEAEINAEYERVKSSYVNEAGFAATLKQLGISETEFKQTLKNNLAITKLVDKEVVDKTKVTDEEAKAFYNDNPAIFEQSERVHARHILKLVEPNAGAVEKDKKRKELEEVQRALKNGSDFSELALKYSDDPSKVNGGDLGYFTRGRMVKPFEDAAFALKPGEISGIVETQFGYHIIKVEDRQPARKIAYEEIKDELMQNLAMRKRQDAISKYIEDLYKKAKITKSEV